MASQVQGQTHSPRIMKERAARNPLLAEKTPRTIYQTKKWSFDPPTAQQVPDRWNYASEEVGLVSQLGSMAERVKKEKAREQEYNSRLKQFEDQQKAKQSSSSASIGGSVSTSRNGDENPPLSTRRTVTSRSQCDSSRLSLPSSSARDDMNHLSSIQEDSSSSSSYQHYNPQTSRPLSEFPVTAIKTLQSTHPEILSKVRAERAVKYIEKLSNPLDPPEYSHVSARIPFRPGGGSLNYSQTRELPGKHHEGGGAGGGGSDERGRNKTLKGTGSAIVKSSSSSSSSLSRTVSGPGSGRGGESLNTERIKENLKSLVKALEETDSEIARQDLKIALAKKVKTYEKKGPKTKNS